MKIYTKSGDQGETGLFGGPRVPKDSLRIEAYGTVDELNAVLGIVRASPLDEDLAEIIARVQNQLFDMGGELATPDPESKGTSLIEQSQIDWQEEKIDAFERELPPLKTFILAGGDPIAAQLHFARCVCRRAERLLVTLSREAKLSPYLLVYLNRLSDFLFVLARTVNHRQGVGDVAWTKGQ